MGIMGNRFDNTLKRVSPLKFKTLKIIYKIKNYKIKNLSFMENKIITRFAPSPTGYMHVGNFRTALYSFLFARKNNGQFLLRIEDTDWTRFVEGSDQNIIDIVKYFNLDFDNEEVVFQSKRLDIYKKYAEQLVSEGKAYYCFCSEEKLVKMKEEQAENKLPPGYWGPHRSCNKLNKDEIAKRVKNGEKYVIRFKMIPDDDISKDDGTWNDLIHGEIKTEMKFQEDFVIIKSDGFPTYNFAHMIDDHEMGVTYVMRGEEFISSTIKHIRLYEAFGWKLPQFAHLPLLLNTDKSKLSKRQGDVAVEDYLKKGYLKEAIINFVVLLGWNPKTEQEIFSLTELVEQFSLDKINKSGAVFNIEKLNWFNQYYIRKMDLDDLTAKCLPYLLDAGLMEKDGEDYKNKETGETVSYDLIKKVVLLARERLVKLDDISEVTKFLFTEKLDYDPELLVWKKSSKEDTAKNLELLKNFLLGVNDFSKKNLETKIKKFIEEKGLGVGDMLWPFRIALSGLKNSPPPFDIVEILGKDKTVKRIESAIVLLK